MPFDPSTLSEDALRYLDQERTRASQTAYENAQKKLLQDENFLNGIRTQLEEEAKLSADERLRLEMEKVNMERRNLATERNRLNTETSLLKSGFEKEEVEKFIPFLVNDDVEVTKTNVENFLNTFNDTMTNRLSNEMKKIMKETPKPQVGGVSGDEGLTLKLREQYKAACQTRNQFEMARIMREANQNNISLN